MLKGYLVRELPNYGHVKTPSNVTWRKLLIDMILIHQLKSKTVPLLGRKIKKKACSHNIKSLVTLPVGRVIPNKDIVVKMP